MNTDDFDELLKRQTMLQARLAKEQEMDEQLDILTVLNEMAPYPDQRIQKESLIVEAMNRGFSNERTEKILDKLIRDRVLFEPMPGYIQRR